MGQDLLGGPGARVGVGARIVLGPAGRPGAAVGVGAVVEVRLGAGFLVPSLLLAEPTSIR